MMNISDFQLWFVENIRPCQSMAQSEKFFEQSTPRNRKYTKHHVLASKLSTQEDYENKRYKQFLQI